MCANKPTGYYHSAEPKLLRGIGSRVGVVADKETHSVRYALEGRWRLDRNFLKARVERKQG